MVSVYIICFGLSVTEGKKKICSVFFPFSSLLSSMFMLMHSYLFGSFNQLDLPEYTSKDQLHERLMLAIHEGSEGFGFGWQKVCWFVSPDYQSSVSYLPCTCQWDIFFLYLCIFIYLHVLLIFHCFFSDLSFAAASILHLLSILRCVSINYNILWLIGYSLCRWKSRFWFKAFRITTTEDMRMVLVMKASSIY